MEEENLDFGELTINTIVEADHVMRKIRSLKARLARADELKKSYIEDARRFYKEEEERVGRVLAPLEYALKAYINGQKEQDPDFKFNTMSGSAYIRQSHPKILWKDEAQVIEYVRSKGLSDLVVTTESLDKRNARRALENHAVMDTSSGVLIDRDGEVIPGVDVEVEPDHIIFRFKEDAV